MPSPNLIAAALTQRTKRCKIAVIGNALPLYNPPLRVAEEFAMLDVMSGGRLVAGMVIGGGPEYFSYQRQSDPCPRAVPRGPRPDRQGVDHAGAVPVELEALLLPLRQSLAAAAAAAAPAHLDSRRRQPGNHRVRGPAPLRLHGHSVFPHRRRSSASSACSARPADKAGYTATPEQMGWGVPIYVAETDTPGPRGVRAALLVLRQATCSRASACARPATPRRARPWPSSRTADHFLAEQKTWDDIEEGRLRHRRQPGDGAAEAGALPARSWASASC